MKLLVVDDHAMIRAGLRQMCADDPAWRTATILEAQDGAAALAHQKKERPQVTILDLNLPGLGGLELLRQMLVADPAARILVFSMHEDAALTERAIQLGARGYVTKSNAPEVLARAVVEVASGRLFLSADVAQAIAASKLAGEDNPLKILTAREFEIFRLLVTGRSATDIAGILNLSAKTVANYHTLIKQKLRVTGDVELVLLALRHNLL